MANVPNGAVLTLLGKLSWHQCSVFSGRGIYRGYNIGDNIVLGLDHPTLGMEIWNNIYFK